MKFEIIMAIVFVVVGTILSSEYGIKMALRIYKKVFGDYFPVKCFSIMAKIGGVVLIFAGVLVFVASVFRLVRFKTL